MKFRKLAEYWEDIEKESSRLEMTEILSRLFKESDRDEIDLVTYLSLGRLRPQFESVEFNLAETMMLRVISVAYKVKLNKVKENFKKIGDLGEVVEKIGKFRTYKTGVRNLSVGEVYKRLFEIAVDEGQGSQDRKVNNMAKLLNNLDLLSAKFVVRIPVDKLRLGFSDMTVLDALSWMEVGNKSLRENLERGFNISADIGQIATIFKRSGLKGVSGIKVKVGVPIRMAQAERLPSAKKIVEKLQVFVVEPKWDGLRVQIHMDKKKRLELAIQENLFGGKKKKFVRIFSRNLDNQTNMFPEIVNEMDKLDVERVILDGEAVAYDPKTGKLLSFQTTVKRKRKHGIIEVSKKYPIKVFIYDVLYINGENLITKSFRERRKKLEELLKKSRIKDLILANQEIVSNVDELVKLNRDFVKKGLEGVMCKKLAGIYQAGARNFNWVKYKKTADESLVDTIDCVVMGYYAGKGRRSDFGIGAFLVGIIDKNGNIGSVAKIGTGVTDEQWVDIKKRCDNFKTKNKPKNYIVDKNLNPDVWVKPEMVVEIMADEVTKSPIHAFGLALRFPRLVRFRDDKNVEQITSEEQLKSM